MSWQDEEWEQEIDYEHIPFRYRQCQKYGHLYRDCPQVQRTPPQNPGGGVRDAEGFEKVGPRKILARKASPQENLNQPKTQNKFEVLNSINEEGEGSDSSRKKQAEKEKHDLNVQKELDSTGPGMGDQENNTEEMEIGELDLDGIDKACDTLSEEYIHFEQIALLQEALIKTKGD